MLKTGSLVTKFDSRRQLESYVGIRQDSQKEFVDFALFFIVICPACLFAAQGKEFDVWSSVNQREPGWVRRMRVKYARRAVEAYLAQIPARLQVIRRAGENGLRLFSTRRDAEDAAVAFDLAAAVLQFLQPLAPPAQAAEFFYNAGVLHLLKVMQIEKTAPGQPPTEELRRRRLTASRAALQAFNRVDPQSAENFEVRELARYQARRFWAAYELRDAKTLAVAGAALQKLNNQYVGTVKKMERDLAQEEAKISKLNEEIRKATSPQTREPLEKAAHEAQQNVQLIRNGLENSRSVLRVIVPIYDEVSLPYEKFKDAQRAQRAAAPTPPQ
jgi:Skp family chaperone for outer membrane proteins